MIVFITPFMVVETIRDGKRGCEPVSVEMLAGRSLPTDTPPRLLYHA
jgi:hypothetical protein